MSQDCIVVGTSVYQNKTVHINSLSVEVWVVWVAQEQPDEVDSMFPPDGFAFVRLVMCV